MSNNQSNASDSSILTLPYTRWDEDNVQSSSAVEALEQGKVLFLPHLAFQLSE